MNFYDFASSNTHFINFKRDTLCMNAMHITFTWQEDAQRERLVEMSR